MNNKFVTPFLPILGLLSVVNHTLNACIGHSIFGEHCKVGRAMTLFLLALALFHKLMSVLLPMFVLPLLGLLSGVKPHLNLLALVIPYSGNPKGKVRYDIVFSLGFLHK